MAPSQQGQSGDAGSLALRRLATPHLVRLLGEWRSGGTAYPALAAALRALIVEGRLPPQTRVPSERALAAALGVSRNTATAALDVLRAEGYLASRRGTGSWVTLPAGDEDRPDEPARRGGRDPGPARADVIDLTVANLPAPPGLGALAAAAAAELPRELGGHGYEPFGLPALRAAVAAHLSARGLPTEPAQVLITQGALHAFDLALRTLARPGDRVLVETPTYPSALDAIRAHGCVPVGVPVGAGGWDLDFMASALRDARPRLGYLIPDFQNPTGFRAPAPARRAVARAARAAGVTLVSDESLAELWLDDAAPAPPSLAAGRPRHRRAGRRLAVQVRVGRPARGLGAGRPRARPAHGLRARQPGRGRPGPRPAPRGQGLRRARRAAPRAARAPARAPRRAARRARRRAPRLARRPPGRRDVAVGRAAGGHARRRR